MHPARLFETLCGEEGAAPLFIGEDPRTRADVLNDVNGVVRALASRSNGPVLLACHDRHHACVGLLASWKAGRVALFPPNLREDAVSSLGAQHEVAVVVSDTGALGTPFRDLLRAEGISRSVPVSESPEDLNRLLATVYTSGSTGDAVACHKTAAQLFGEASYLADLFGIERDSRFLASAPPHHIYGLLFGVLMPLFAGASSVRRCSFLPASIAREVSECFVDTLCAVPPHLAGLMAVLPRELGPLRRIFCSAGRLDAELSEALSARFEVEVIEVFGSSETGGIAYRSDPRGAWRPFDRVAVSRDRDGALLVESPFLPPGNHEPYRSGDRIELHADGSFSHLGRIDDVVKIGGERVSVQEVERKIRQLEGVKDAVVVQVPASGPRQWELWACVVAEGVSEESVRQSLRKVLEPVAVPRRFKLVTELPRESSGKIAKKRILELFEQDSA